MLQVLSELIRHRGQNKPGSDLRWLELQAAELAEQFPFWQAADIDRVRSSLQSLGILQFKTAHDGRQYLAIDQTRHQARRDSTSGSISNSSGPATIRRQAHSNAGQIPPDWKPDDNWIRLCKQHAIPDDFIHSLVP